MGGAILAQIIICRFSAARLLGLMILSITMNDSECPERSPRVEGFTYCDGGGVAERKPSK